MVVGDSKLRGTCMKMSMRRNLISSAIIAITVLILAACSSPSSQSSPSIRAKGHVQPRTDGRPKNGTANGLPVCSQPILKSPFNYDGTAGAYKSGTAGLPTYGTPGSDFPNDTAGVVLPNQTMNYQNWQLRSNTVYYLKPGVHIGNFSADTDDAFVGGYSGGTG